MIISTKEVASLLLLQLVISNQSLSAKELYETMEAVEVDKADLINSNKPGTIADYGEANKEVWYPGIFITKDN